MTNYVQVLPEQIPPGRSALVLFVDAFQLGAGVLKHRCDGRFERVVSQEEAGRDVIRVICAMMAERPDEDLLIVIEPPAYWPDAFPTLVTFSLRSEEKFISNVIL